MINYTQTKTEKLIQKVKEDNKFIAAQGYYPPQAIQQMIDNLTNEELVSFCHSSKITTTTEGAALLSRINVKPFCLIDRTLSHRKLIITCDDNIHQVNRVYKWTFGESVVAWTVDQEHPVVFHNVVKVKEIKEIYYSKK